jgi:hypothetical protein
MNAMGYAAEERRRKMFAVILIAAAITLIGAVVLGGFATSTSSSDDSANQGAADKDDEEGSSDEADDEGDEGGKGTEYPFNRTVVNANVEGTAVFVDGVKQCDATPCRISVPVGDGTPHEIRLKKDGYIDVVQNWAPNSVTEPLPALPDLKKL